MKLDKLTEATMRALRGKLDEVYIKQYVETFDELYDSSWGPAIEVLDKIAENDLEDALMDWLEDLGTEDAPIDRTDLNDYIIFQSEDIYDALGLDENGDPLNEGKKQEARSHKEDNEKAAPRTVKNVLGNDVKTREMVDVSNPAVGNKSYHNEKGNQYWGTTEAEYASKRNKTGQKNEYGRDVYLAPFKNKGDWTIKADRMEPATATARYQYNKEQAEGAKERVDFYTKELKRVRSPYKRAVAQNQIDGFEKTQKEYDDKAHQIYQDMKDKQNKEREIIANKSTETKKVTEATTDVNEVVDEYKEAYHKDLDLKTVPCVIARDKMLSGWGGAEGRNHYQVVLCADSTEAHNIANNMQAQAKREQLANVRVSFGVKLPSRASVAYCVGRNASAWNMGNSWYERYDTEKKTEAIDENLKAYTVTVSDEENQHSFQFYAEKDKTLDDVFNEIYDYVIF